MLSPPFTSWHPFSVIIVCYKILCILLLALFFLYKYVITNIITNVILSSNPFFSSTSLSPIIINIISIKLLHYRRPLHYYGCFLLHVANNYHTFAIILSNTLHLPHFQVKCNIMPPHIVSFLDNLRFLSTLHLLYVSQYDISL